MNTARHKLRILIKSISAGSLVNCPTIPDMEFTSIKILDVAAIFRGVSHFIKFNNGERKIPPPIPTNPDKTNTTT